MFSLIEFFLTLNKKIAGYRHISRSTTYFRLEIHCQKHKNISYIHMADKSQAFLSVYYRFLPIFIRCKTASDVFS